jgi:translation initiation factor IF-2
MTDNQKDTKAKKLTLGGARLSLGNYSKKVITPVGSSGSVVVEVKRGKAAGNSLTLSNSSNTAVDSEQNERRLEALSRSKSEIDKTSQLQIGSLSRLAEINQDKKEQEETSNKKVEDTKKEVVVEKIPNSNKREQKKNPVNITSKQQKEKTEEETIALVKPKIIEQKKLKKSDIIHMLDEDSEGRPSKTRSLAAIKRAREKERRKNEGVLTKAEKLYREVILPEVITVADLSNRMSERASDVTRELMKMGVIATSTQSIDADTAELVAIALGHSVKRIKESDIEDTLIDKVDLPEDLKPRAPIVTIMGHVDHGKTSLLDALKSTDVAAGEAGGITQHIGAYTITISDNRMITFIDTPGHEAFTQMRMRGTQVTDIVVLVVAADDGIKAQTIEAISHAKAANVPIIVAINKIDKPDADVNRVKTELLSHELVSEDFGGDIITVGVSAKEKQNLDKLEEIILLVAEMQELRANPHAVASGVVIESKIDQSRGVVVTVIVQRGTLKKGDIIIAGSSYGRVRTICNDKGRSVNSAEPSVAVEIYGLNDAPLAGDKFNVVETDKQARDIIEYRQRKARERKVTASKTSLEDLFLRASGENKVKELPIIIKGDVHGSIEAITTSLSKIESDEVKLRILHSGVGGITESDVSLAAASRALIVGFNTRANNAAATAAEDNKIDIRYYSIIYNIIDDIKSIMSGMLSPILREEYIGSVDVREIFNISKIGKVAGSYVTRGIIKRGAGGRLLRDNIVIHEGKLKTLKRFKEDVKEVREGFECGIAFEGYNDIKVGDKVEVFEIVKEQKKL